MHGGKSIVFHATFHGGQDVVVKARTLDLETEAQGSVHYSDETGAEVFTLSLFTLSLFQNQIHAGVPWGGGVHRNGRLSPLPQHEPHHRRQHLVQALAFLGPKER